MKDITKLGKIIFGFFVSIVVVFVLVQKILQKNKKAELIEVEDTSTKTEEKKVTPRKVVEEKEIVVKTKLKPKPIKVDSKNGLLSSRQKKILSLFEKTSEPVDMDGISAGVKGVHVRTLRRDLTKLSNLRLIKKVGSTKGTSYKKV